MNFHDHKNCSAIWGVFLAFLAKRWHSFLLPFFSHFQSARSILTEIRAVFNGEGGEGLVRCYTFYALNESSFCCILYGNVLAAMRAGSMFEPRSKRLDRGLETLRNTICTDVLHATLLNPRPSLHGQSHWKPIHSENRYIQKWKYVQ